MTSVAEGFFGRADPATVFRAARDLGPLPLALYATYRLSLATGWVRRQTPATNWGAPPVQEWFQTGVACDPLAYLEYRRSVSSKVHFFFNTDGDLASRLRRVVGGPRPVLDEADAILDGVFRLFGGRQVRLGFPPDWAAPAELGEAEGLRPLDLHNHWIESEAGIGNVDVKLVWEASRFGWAFALVRAARMSGERKYAEGFWSLFLSWKAANQPNRGVNWISAQEAALRVMAVIFAVYGFAPFWKETPDRMLDLAEFIAVHAARIPPTLAYARAQGNNHLIMEATALYTVGMLFPEMRDAGRWRQTGRRWLLEALRRQFFRDGGYIQHSSNYHRLALEAGLWAARLAALNDDPLPPDALETLGRSVTCLAALVDPATGEVPNLGANDGAMFLPLSRQPFGDFRPLVQAASVMFRGKAAFGPGAWDELSLWFGLAGGAHQSEPTEAIIADNFPDAGLHFLRGKRSRGILRCAHFTSRPGHSDQLHFDLWRDGHNVLRDPGTYRYRADPPWDNALADARVHNTVTLAGLEPMRRAGRFLWLDWDQGRLLGRRRSADGALELVAAERNGYRSLGITHTRTVVRAGDDLWLVVDDLVRTGADRSRGMATPPVAVAGWGLPDWFFALDGRRLTLEVPGEEHPLRVEPSAGRAGLYRAGQLVAGVEIRPALPVWGWWSKTYASKDPCLYLAVEIGGGLPLRLSTWWCFGGASPTTLTIGWAEPGPKGRSMDWLDYHGQRLDL